MSDVPAKSVFLVHARWDQEAGVWIAESDDVPGLVAEAESPNLLATKLRVLIPELLDLNHVPASGDARFQVQYQYEEIEVLAR